MGNLRENTRRREEVRRGRGGITGRKVVPDTAYKKVKCGSGKVEGDREGW
jgi:hypothetical protein